MMTRSHAFPASHQPVGAPGDKPQRGSKALRVFLIASRLLPVILQAALLVMAIVRRSGLLIIMSATSCAMSAATAIQSLVGMRANHRTVQSSAPVAEKPPGGSAISSSHAASLTPEEAASSRIPPIRLCHMLGAGDDGPGLWRRCVRLWMSHRTRIADLTAPVGRLEDGRLLVLDLVRDGPHSLVAGTTGSGKSVLLESWCAALALCYPPDRLSFVFLDFKGGATFRNLSALPHTVGTVSDLSLQQARRALLGLERELRHRERLLAAHRAARLEMLDNPPPRLLVVIDEFNALRQSLPDYLPRLARLASQGRSMGIHLILATQSPTAEVPRTIQANIGTNVCLRVRDALQSTDLVGTRAAAFLPSSQPGTAVIEAGEGPVIARAPLPSPKTVAACQLSLRFLEAAGMHQARPRRLFTPPLPESCTLEDCASLLTADGGSAASTIPSPRSARTRKGLASTHVVGLADDGVMTHPALLDLSEGNIAVCGPSGRGKSVFCRLLHRLDPTIAVIDDADPLLDPLSTNPQARKLQARLANPSDRTAYAIHDPRLVRFPSQCAIRLFFPTGDRSADMLSGIPGTATANWDRADYSVPGRALLATASGWTTIQIAQSD